RGGRITWSFRRQGPVRGLPPSPARDRLYSELAAAAAPAPPAAPTLVPGGSRPMARARARSAKDQSFVDFVLDQLGSLGGLRSRAMFGGHGIYRGEDFFGIVHRGRLFFKTGDGNRAAYLERGMAPFRPNAKQELARYYEVPLEVIEDPQ